MVTKHLVVYLSWDCCILKSNNRTICGVFLFKIGIYNLRIYKALHAAYIAYWILKIILRKARNVRNSYYCEVFKVRNYWNSFVGARKILLHTDYVFCYICKYVESTLFIFSENLSWILIYREFVQGRDRKSVV